MNAKRMLISTSFVGVVLTTGLATPAVAMAATNPHAGYLTKASSAPTLQVYKYEKAEVIVNGKVLLGNAVRFVANNTTYISLYDAELLVTQLTGDARGVITQNPTTGHLSKTQQWDGKVWNIAWEHSNPMTVANNSGNATFEINDTPVINAPVLVAQPPGALQPTTFVPIWYVQQVVDQIIYTNSTTDTWEVSGSMGKWTITYDPNQTYSISGANPGLNITGTGSTINAPVTGPGWGN